LERNHGRSYLQTLISIFGLPRGRWSNLYAYWQSKTRSPQDVGYTGSQVWSVGVHSYFASRPTVARANEHKSKMWGTGQHTVVPRFQGNLATIWLLEGWCRSPLCTSPVIYGQMSSGHAMMLSGWKRWGKRTVDRKAYLMCQRMNPALWLVCDDIKILMLLNLSLTPELATA
jgi:hypothetical protein